MSTRHALAHRHDLSFAATGDRGEAHMTWLLGPSSDGCAGLYSATDGAQPVMRFGDRIRQDRPGLIAVRAAGKPDLEGDHDAGQPVTVGIAGLVRVGPHMETVRFGPARGENVDVDAAQPAMTPSSSSAGVKLVSLPVPNLSWPRMLVTVNTPWVTRSTVTVRCEEPSAIPMPCQATGWPARPLVCDPGRTSTRELKAT